MGVKISKRYSYSFESFQYWKTFDLLVFRIILGSFSALGPKWPVTLKRLVIEQNGIKFVIRG